MIVIGYVPGANGTVDQHANLCVCMSDTICFLSAGNKTYVAFLYLEHTQNNSVLNVFVNLLLDSRRKASFRTAKYTTLMEEGGKYV